MFPLTFTQGNSKKLKFILILAAGVVIAAFGLARSVASSEKTVTIDGASRPYYVYLPKTYTGSQPVPVVFVLHPMLTSARWAESFMGWDQCADKNGFIVVYGQAANSNGEWNTGLDVRIASSGADDIGYLEAVIRSVRASYRIDRSRVYMVGFSSGAIMTAKMGALIPNSLAAIGTVEGMTGYLHTDSFVPTAPISMIAFRGTSDRIIPYSSTVYPAVSTAYDWAKSDNCYLTPSSFPLANNLQVTDYTGGSGGSEVQLVTVNGGRHVYHPGYTDTIWQFFAKHPKHVG